jgi:hypothetical protein
LGRRGRFRLPPESKVHRAGSYDSRVEIRDFIIGTLKVVVSAPIAIHMGQEQARYDEAIGRQDFVTADEAAGATLDGNLALLSLWSPKT